MYSFQSLEDGYNRNWANLQIRPTASASATKTANQLLKGKDTYQRIQAKTGVPWYFIGLCHYREASFNFGKYLGNGQPLDQVTTDVPRGRGPFTGANAFVDGAVDALRLQSLVGASDWSIARILYRLEGYNGFGYHNFGVNSPYLYGGSTLYGPPEAKGGKYISDGVFSASAIDTQLGTAVILKALMALDSSISFDASSPPVGESSEPDDDMATTVLLMQRLLNALDIVTPPLAEDGISGPKTKAAIALFQEQNRLPSTGLLDGTTTAAIIKSATPAPQPQLPTATGTPTTGTMTVSQPAAGTPAKTATPTAGTTTTTSTTGGTPTTGTDVAQILQRIDDLITQVQSGKLNIQTSDLLTLLQKITTATGGPAAGATTTTGTTGGTPTTGTDVAQVLQRIEDLLTQIQSGKFNLQSTDPLTLLQKILSMVPLNIGQKQAQGPAAPTSNDQLQQVINVLNVLLSQGQTPALGQVNGALGDTIGNLLNGKKSAIGIGGSLLTTLLMNVPTDAGVVAQSGALVKMLAPIVSAVPGLGQVALPVFLAISAWGVLGKLEKWAQGTAPPPKPQS